MKWSTGCWHKGLSILLSSTMNVHSSTSVIKNFRPWGILNFLSLLVADTTLMSWYFCNLAMNYVMTIMHHWQFISVLLKYIDIAFHNTFFSFNESHIVRLMLYSKNEYIISFDMGNREGNLNFLAWTFLCSKMFCLIPNMCDIFAFILTCWQFLLYCTDNRCMLTWKRKGILE